jgi:hypothetical protein
MPYPFVLLVRDRRKTGSFGRISRKRAAGNRDDRAPPPMISYKSSAKLILRSIDTYADTAVNVGNGRDPRQMAGARPNFLRNRPMAKGTRLESAC